MRTYPSPEFVAAEDLKDQRRAENNRRWREKNAERKRAQQAAWHVANKDRIRSQKRLKLYGVSDVAMFAAQGGRCACCQTTITMSAHIDHDHTTGKTRGMLCKTCNLALGHALEDPMRLRALADYIDRWSGA